MAKQTMKAAAAHGMSCKGDLRLRIEEKSNGVFEVFHCGICDFESIGPKVGELKALEGQA